MNLCLLVVNYFSFISLKGAFVRSFKCIFVHSSKNVSWFTRLNVSSFLVWMYLPLFVQNVSSFRTYANLERAKTSRNQPKRLETNWNDPQKLWNDPKQSKISKLGKSGIFLLAFVFQTSSPNVVILGKEVSTF